MEKIITYVNNVFSAFPHTEEAARLKMQFIDTLIEKYQAFLAEGKNEHEAFGMAIAGFGDIEEIKKTLNPEQSEPYTDSNAPAPAGKPPLDASGIIAVYREIQQTLKHHTRWELRYAAIGTVILIVCTVVTAMLRFVRHTRISGELSSIGAVIFFICIGFAAAHFLFYALRSLQVEKEIFSLTGKPEAKSTAELFEVLKKEGKPFAKKLQGTVFALTALFFLLVMITGGPFEIALFVLGMGGILHILIGIWLK
ncbi:MAG: permease prefix domain 1-containing protein [Treponema sp.]